MARVADPAQRPYTAHNRRALPAEEIAQRYLSGDSILGLAKRYRVGRFAIQRRLIEQGIPLRSQAEAERRKWARMTSEQRAAQIEAAHAASRGRRPSTIERERTAATREAQPAAPHVGRNEARLLADLIALGYRCVAQQAVGPYNIDVAVDESVAVEIFGGGWHTAPEHRARAQERSRYLLRAGWHLLIIWIDERRYPYSARVADDLIAFMEQARRDPAGRGEYRVIRGDGKLVAAGRADDDYLAVESPSLRRANGRP